MLYNIRKRMKSHVSTGFPSHKRVRLVAKSESRGFRTAEELGQKEAHRPRRLAMETCRGREILLIALELEGAERTRYSKLHHRQIQELESTLKDDIHPAY
jgi:hypothetical protein